jgi:hypothetical protein
VPSANVTASSERAAGGTSAAPKPCTARAPISRPADPDRPASSDADVNNARPVSSVRRRPSRSAALPPNSRNPPSVRPYAMTIHCNLLRPTPRSCWIEGRATFTIATSSTTMNCATQSSRRTTPLWVCLISGSFQALITWATGAASLAVWTPDCARTEHSMPMRSVFASRTVDVRSWCGDCSQSPHVRRSVPRSRGVCTTMGGPRVRRRRGGDCDN